MIYTADVTSMHQMHETCSMLERAFKNLALMAGYGRKNLMVDLVACAARRKQWAHGGSILNRGGKGGGETRLTDALKRRAKP